MGSTPPAGGVLWDLDGTLIDSGEQHYAAWRDALAARGREHPREEFARLFGRRNDVILRKIFGDDLSAREAARVADDKEERYRRLVRRNGLEPLPGVMDWLHRLKERRFRQALATMAPAANVAVVIEVLDLVSLIDATAAAEDVVHGKPDPAIFLEAARRIGVPAERCVVMEDAPAGLEGARRAGMRSVGIVSNHHRELQADIVVPSLTALPAGAIEELLGP
ncbi:MAG: HAD family phosphatase [Acidobacteria bacterium]|jgi:HAD superfamily hydrolase (TIGR01509 family)|nr:HAD family phosphatase [Acidobacteriota bacterium]